MKMIGTKALIHYHTMPNYDSPKIDIRVENIVRKGAIDCNKQFLFFSQCFFYLKWHLFFILSAL